jgi:hypothetical protein
MSHLYKEEAVPFIVYDPVESSNYTYFDLPFKY